MKAGVESNENTHQPRLYDNVPTSTGGEKVAGASLQAAATESWSLGSRSRSQRLSGKLLEDNNLPPPPAPPTTSLLLSSQVSPSTTTTTTSGGGGGRSGPPSRFNGIDVANNTPPAVAPKPLIQYSPKTFDLAGYNQSTF